MTWSSGGLAESPVDLLRCIDTAGRPMLLHFALGFGLVMLEGLVDQPHPLYADGGTWLAPCVFVAVAGGATAAVGVAALIVLDQAVRPTRHAGPDELAYYPRPAGLRRCLSVMPA